MRQLGLREVEAQLASWCGQPVYVHLEVNPEAYVRNARMTLHRAGVFGDGLYRVHLWFRDPDGMLYIQDVTEFVDDGGKLVLMGLDGQNRVRQTLTVSDRPLEL